MGSEIDDKRTPRMSRKGAAVTGASNMVRGSDGIDERPSEVPEFETDIGRLLETLGSAECGIAVIEGGRVVYMNRALSKILGREYDDLSGEKSPSFFPFVCREGDPNGSWLREAIERGGTIELQAPVLSGERKWVQVTSRPMEEAGGQVQVVTVKDISRYKELELELRMSEGKYRAVLEKSPINIYIADLSTMRIIETNPAMQNMLGYTEDELTRMTPFDFLDHPLEDVERKIEGLGDREFKVVGERRYKKKDGSVIDVEVFGNKIDYEGGRAICIVSWDITERKRASQQIMKLNEVLRLTSKITRHDIRNWLTVAYGILGLMRDGTPVSPNMMDEAYKAVERSIELLRRMNELDAMIMGDERLTAYDAKDIFEGVLDDHKVKYSIEGEGQVLADAALVSVIDNMVSNAVVHGRTDRMKVTISAKGASCEVRVSDFGKGIPDEVKPRIFEEGFTYGDKGGTGLGLSIVNTTMERYGGSVRVEDNLPNGTTFVLTFKSPVR